MDSAALESGSTLLIQQTPEVIRVQSKPEKKPGTPPPAPAPATASPAPTPRSPSPPPGSSHSHPSSACHQHSQVLLPSRAPCHWSSRQPRCRHRCHRDSLQRV
ncbi:hypothetical protein fugu_016841 [Takifugu bimaculatus]|uniref:Uncharacterized protein n=1 Tax=Takifugu bimaculatus TaxID=433685 RepID=A0A4Z2BVM7_9TELE|nr:hypothetical protein fugu_016841 [Takifugu bimaculatus]